MQRVLPGLVLFVGDVRAAIAEAIDRLGATSQRFVAERSQPRPARHVKPHPSCAYKG